VRSGLALGALHRAALKATGPGSAALRRTVALVDGRAESPIETCLRLLALPLAVVDLQVPIAGVGRVDMLLDGWLVLEADGFEHHSTRAHYRVDRRRADALAEQGFVLVRFSYQDIVHRPDYVVATIRLVLTRRNHLDGAGRSAQRCGGSSTSWASSSRSAPPDINWVRSSRSMSSRVTLATIAPWLSSMNRSPTG